jgi:tetratricopeptide (TPR) repeat protein
MAIRYVSPAIIMKNSTEEEWLRWIEIQKSATHVWLNGSLSRAVEIVNLFIASNPPLDLKRQAIGFRGSLYEEQGDLAAAKSDFLTARNLADSRDFERCSLEEAAAFVSYELGETAEAERWYLEALRTAAADPRASGGSVLSHLLEIRGEVGLTAEERLLAEEVVKEGWRFHELSGSPELHDLRAAAQALVRAQSTPKRRTMGGEGP